MLLNRPVQVLQELEKGGFQTYKDDATSRALATIDAENVGKFLQAVGAPTKIDGFTEFHHDFASTDLATWHVMRKRGPFVHSRVKKTVGVESGMGVLSFHKETSPNNFDGPSDVSWTTLRLLWLYPESTTPCLYFDLVRTPTGELFALVALVWTTKTLQHLNRLMHPDGNLASSLTTLLVPSRSKLVSVLACMRSEDLTVEAFKVGKQLAKFSQEHEKPAAAWKSVPDAFKKACAAAFDDPARRCMIPLPVDDTIRAHVDVTLSGYEESLKDKTFSDRMQLVWFRQTVLIVVPDFDFVQGGQTVTGDIREGTHIDGWSCVDSEFEAKSAKTSETDGE